MPQLLPVPARTHTVTNQVPALEGFNAFADDPLLGAVLRNAGADVSQFPIQALGEFAGLASTHELAYLANRFVPELIGHDRFGQRLDEVRYHPAYHALMKAGCERGVHALAWSPQITAPFPSHAGLVYLWNQVELGTACPMTMTFASVHLMRQAPQLAAVWEPRLTAFAYDPQLAPIEHKRSALVGMAMTEKQGGTDLRAIQTTAACVDGPWHALTGHKWFCSAPMSDGFFTLAKTQEGATCFFAPRVSPDGSRNRILFQRLKDKCGNRSNASSEIEYDGALAHLVGEPGRGISTLIEMAHLTRFDITLSVAGIMRYALRHALHHAQHRQAFGQRLAEHALMKNVLADLSLEWEAATRLAFYLAQLFDGGTRDEVQKDLVRLVTPIAKYWLCKRLTGFVAEAMEVLGGNGFIEEGPLARVYREAPLNGIWEGSGNVMCLDVLRAIGRDPDGFDALVSNLRSQLSADAAAASMLDALPAMVGNGAESHARRLTECLALLMQAALMRAGATPARADAFADSRLARGHGQYGTLRVVPPLI